ncbi:hypothetical protein B0H14DRAFT_1320125 [Mycena olivaceomarginata]|nr:hypothetical protein B0H14DRAFT_1320125 [Mycena olivaceomarginata]
MRKRGSRSRTLNYGSRLLRPIQMPFRHQDVFVASKTVIPGPGPEPQINPSSRPSEHQDSSRTTTQSLMANPVQNPLNQHKWCQRHALEECSIRFSYFLTCRQSSSFGARIASIVRHSLHYDMTLRVFLVRKYCPNGSAWCVPSHVFDGLDAFFL